MVQFRDGDIPAQYLSLVVGDVNAFVGTWEQMKDVSVSTETLLSELGIGFIKRKAIGAVNLKTEIQVRSIDSKGNPVLYYKTHYALGVTKETSFPTDGSIVNQPDPDTCDWKTLGVFCNGRLIQKRTGSKGTMYDARCILQKHPTGASKEAPIMCFVWTFIDTKGKKTVAEQYMKKIK